MPHETQDYVSGSEYRRLVLQTVHELDEKCTSNTDKIHALDLLIHELKRAEESRKSKEAKQEARRESRRTWAMRLLIGGSVGVILTVLGRFIWHWVQSGLG